MKICFTGDLFLGGDLLNKSTKNIIDIDVFKSADKRVVNLEQSISDSNTIADKGTIYTDSSSISHLVDMRIDSVNLAHNHIQDKGLNGIKETIEHLNGANISNFGAGSNILESKQPYFVDENIVLFGYCEFDKPYLKLVEVADDNKEGVNPLRYDNIISDLNTLKDNQKAILYFHWGREDVFFPPHHDIELAKKLLEDHRVLLIVGMHPHRPQGYIEHNGKRAYMSLGNFLFPNIYVKYPRQIYYPSEEPKEFDTTWRYHNVYKLTYKKWRWINRVSLVLEFDSETSEINHTVVIQDDNKPEVSELQGFQKNTVLFLVWFLSKIYKFPKNLYIPIEKINTFLMIKIWRVQIYWFQLKQLGIKEFSKKFINKELK